MSFSNILYKHIVQSHEWGLFKAKMGTPAITVGDIQITKHKIPFTPWYIGYAPRVNFYEQKFSFKELKDFAKDENCVCIRFDVPNILQSVDSSNTKYLNLLDNLKKNCKLSPKSTFATCNVLLDISGTISTIFANLNQKTRYNIRIAEKHGVIASVDNTEEGFDTFYKLHTETAKRQGFLGHSKVYYKRAFETLASNNMANIIIAYKDHEPLAAWMLFNYKGVLYYPYGGSSHDNRQFMPSNLLCFEAIKVGKMLGCHTFDMWGATDNEHDPYWGFTRFKLGYGGELVKYIPSYDFVVNKPVYHLFNMSYGLFWKVIKTIKK